MEKTEFLIIGSEYNLRPYPNLTLNVDTTEIKPVSSVRNLGVCMDSDGSMTSQVGGLCRTLNFQLKNIARIRKYLDQDTCQHIVRSFVLSRLDYGNSLLAGSTNAQSNKLQHLQNRAACLICSAKRHEHISPYLTRIHCLPVHQCVNLKLLVYIYQCLIFTKIPFSLILFCITLKEVLIITSILRLIILGSTFPKLTIPQAIKAFFVIGPHLWNMLPMLPTRETASLTVFKKILKTYLFSQSI